MEFLLGALLITSLVLWFWTISDIAGSRFAKGNQKTAWLIGVLFFPVLGSILYFQLKKRFVINRRVFRPDFN